MASLGSVTHQVATDCKKGRWNRPEDASKNDCDGYTGDNEKLAGLKAFRIAVAELVGKSLTYPSVSRP